MGSKIEGFKNSVKYGAVYGGSEEIMADLAIKQARLCSASVCVYGFAWLADTIVVRRKP